MVKVEVQSVAALSYSITVEANYKTQDLFVRDDGWKIWVKDSYGRHVDSISFGADSERVADMESSLQEITKWAESKYGK